MFHVIESCLSSHISTEVFRQGSLASNILYAEENEKQEVTGT